jgi:cytochrome c553
MQTRVSQVTVATGLLISLLLWSTSSLAVPQKLGDPIATNTNPHNLSSSSASAINANGGETDEICIFCHTPHSASSRGALWNRPDITTPLGGGSFPIYGVVTPSDTILIDTIAAADYNQGGQYPNGATRLCLSCHDGVTAIGEVIPTSGGVIAPSLGPMTTMVIDLSTSHPISFVYNAAVETVLDDKPTPGANFYKLPSPGILDDQSRMQCTSCHDPHLDTNEPGYTLPMWRNYTGDENLDYEGTCGECHVGGSTSGGLVDTMPLPLPGPIH